MAKFSITMSNDLGTYVSDTMQDRKFDNISEYFRHLVRQDLDAQKADVELRALIDEGLKSGVSSKTVTTIWADAIRENTK